MKAIIITFIFFLSLKEIYSQQSGWTWVNRYPQGNFLVSSSISSSNTAFIVSDYGTLLKTTNDGTSWDNVYTLPLMNFYTTILFLNSITGFTLGSYPNNNIYKTTDGGNNWFTLNTGLNESMNSIFFYNDNTGVAVGGNGRLIKTFDGGNTWIIVPPAINMSLWDFTGFNNSNACYARTSSGILKSYSMGDNWLTLTIPDSTRGISDMFFLNENTGMYIGAFGYYGSSAKFVKTTNGGFSWFWYNIAANVQLNTLYFLNENTGFITGGIYNNSGTILKTTNGGINWTIQADSIKYYIGDIEFFNQNTGFASGTYGTLLTTTNGGTNWSYYSRGFIDYINDIYFLNEQTGYISISIYSKKLLKTTNGGTSWDTLFIPPENIYTIKFVNSNTGYIGGGDNYYAGFIYKTTNAGLNWISQTYYQYQPVRQIQFLNDLSGYAMESAGKILKTTNGGNNWDSISAGGGLFSMNFVNINTGFLTGGGRIYKTTNAGLNWQFINLGNGNLWNIRFVNEQTGFAVGNFIPYMFKTTNQGITWDPISVSFFNSMTDIFFNDINTGYILGYDKIYKTTDCGATWGYQKAIYDELGSIYFINTSTGYVGGSNGTFLKTTTGGGNFVGVNKIQYEIPESFSLSQNFPNPFNPSTTIRFDIPIDVKSQTSNVKLVIYDVLGREAATLVNQQLKPGTYEVSWDASNYPSGVYFYRLTTNDYTETRKMVLIK